MFRRKTWIRVYNFDIVNENTSLAAIVVKGTSGPGTEPCLHFSPLVVEEFVLKINSARQ